MIEVQPMDSVSEPGFFSALKLLSRFLGSGRVALAKSVAMASLSVALELAPIVAILWLIEGLVAGSAAPADFVLAAFVLAMTIPSVQLLFGYATAQSHAAAFHTIHALRVALARKLSAMPLGAVSTLGSGATRKLMIDEPEKLEPLIAHAIPEGVSAGLMWLVVSIWLIATDWVMALATIALTPVAFGAIAIAVRRTQPRMEAFQAANLRMNGTVAEFLRGITAVKIYHRTGPAQRRTRAAIDDFARFQSEWGREFVPWGGTFYALIQANITVILPVGLWRLQTGGIEVEALLLFILLGGNYGAPLMRLFNLFSQMAHVSLAVQSVERLLRQPTLSDTETRLPLNNHAVEFETVSFAYGAARAIDEVSFVAPQGEVTALVGPSGAGKSTLALLLARFYDPLAGRITVGGQNIAEMGQAQLMDTVSFVFQDTFLFRGTIAENLRFAQPDASQGQLENAATAAQAHNFIRALPDGYDTMIGDGSGVLSGGERQRIGIARAILKNAPILVLDEATAFADPDSEADIQKAISAMARGKTLIVVAHRLHTIAKAQQVVVMDAGRVVGRGAHDDLLRTCDLYARMWEDYSASRDAPQAATDMLETAQ